MQIKYKRNNSINFSDEIIIGKVPIVCKNFDNYSDIELTPKHRKNNGENKSFQNNLFNYSISFFLLTAVLIFLYKIISSTFINFGNITSTLFVSIYFLLLGNTLFFVLRKKMLSLKVKNKILHIKSFPVLNVKIPTDQILRCEVNAISNDQSIVKDKLHFALNENGNKYKQIINDGMLLQMINGQYIIIGSAKG